MCTLLSCTPHQNAMLLTAALAVKLSCCTAAEARAPPPARVSGTRPRRTLFW